MGRGFVHQEKVGWIEKKFDESEAGFFSSAQDSHRFEDIISAKKKGTENRAGGLFTDRVGRVENGFENLMIHI
jgi:hypothetical protein